MLPMLEWTITVNKKHIDTEPNGLLLSAGIESYRVISRLNATSTRYQISVRQLLRPDEESRIVASAFNIYIIFKVTFQYII